MTLQGEQEYRRLIEDELRSAGFLEPPVDVEAVAAHLGVPIVSFDLPLWFTAALIYEDGLPMILMNGSRPQAIRRAGLAHLLGHILVVMAMPDARYPREAQPHTAADFMAAEFETPAFMVRDQAQKWFNDYRYLAGLFGVTEVRMFESMRDLGLIKSKGVIWEY